MIAHAIAVIGRDRYGRDTDPEHVLSLAVYHDATEVMTGDLPTPVKYHNEELRGAYRRLEDVSADRLLSLLPARCGQGCGQDFRLYQMPRGEAGRQPGVRLRRGERPCGNRRDRAARGEGFPLGFPAGL